MMVRLSAATLGKHRQCFRELPLFFFISLLLSTAVGGNSIFAHVTDKGPFYCGTALSFFFSPLQLLSDCKQYITYPCSLRTKIYIHKCMAVMAITTTTP